MRLAVLVIALAACHTPAQPTMRELPATARLQETGGAFIARDRYQGHVVVLDFWAGWCEDCRKMVPQLARLAQAFAADGVLVVGINAGEHPDEAARYARDLGMTYAIALDPDLSFSDLLGAADLPVLLVIDRTGAIVHRSRHLDEATIESIRHQVR